jgi:hypothetical protein
VQQTSAGLVNVELRNVVALKAGGALSTSTSLIGHVHNAACTNGDSGAHWRVDPNGPADVTNEVCCCCCCCCCVVDNDLLTLFHCLNSCGLEVKSMANE